MVVQRKICKQNQCIIYVRRHLWSSSLTSRPALLLKARVTTKLEHIGKGKSCQHLMADKLPEINHEILFPSVFC